MSGNQPLDQRRALPGNVNNLVATFVKNSGLSGVGNHLRPIQFLTALFRPFVACLASLQLTVAALLAAMVLVFIGTLAQVKLGLYVTQTQYFQSLLVYWGPEGKDWKIPVWPGGWLLGGVLLVNLIAAHLKRFQFSWKKSGIFLIHFGLITLLLGQFLTEIFQVESFMVISNGGTKNFSEDGRKHELAIADITDPRQDKVVVIPEARIAAKGEIKAPQLPFAIRVREFFANSVPVDPTTRAEGKRFSGSRGFAWRMALEERPVTDE